jgi:hypothetical protein
MFHTVKQKNCPNKQDTEKNWHLFPCPSFNSKKTAELLCCFSPLRKDGTALHCEAARRPCRLYLQSVGLGGLALIAPAIGTKVRGFKPGRKQCIFKGD